MKDAIAELSKAINAIHALSATELDAFTSVFNPHSTNRKEILTRTDATEKYLYFITAGAQRIFSCDEKGNEATIIFTYPYSFGGVLDSFMLQQPSKYTYETLTASAFLRASYTDLQQVLTKHPAIGIMLNKGLSFALSGVLERLAEIQMLSSEEKLKALFKRSPHIFQLIPQKYLAGYLGIDATNFSKLMNSVRL